MGMQFSPMYQPVSTKTIKADGDLNVSPYDVEAYDGRFDTVEADEFVGGVGNFTTMRGQRIIDWTCSTSGSTIVFPARSYSTTSAFTSGSSQTLFNDVLPSNDLSGFDAGFGNELGTLGQEFNLVISCTCSNDNYCRYFNYKAEIDGNSYTRTGAGALSVPITNVDSVLTLTVTSTFPSSLGTTASMGYANYYLASI